MPPRHSRPPRSRLRARAADRGARAREHGAHRAAARRGSVDGAAGEGARRSRGSSAIAWVSRRRPRSCSRSAISSVKARWSVRSPTSCPPAPHQRAIRRAIPRQHRARDPRARSRCGRCNSRVARARESGSAAAPAAGCAGEWAVRVWRRSRSSWRPLIRRSRGCATLLGHVQQEDERHRVRRRARRGVASGLGARARSAAPARGAQRGSRGSSARAEQARAGLVREADEARAHLQQAEAERREGDRGVECGAAGDARALPSSATRSSAVASARRAKWSSSTCSTSACTSRQQELVARLARAGEPSRARALSRSSARRRSSRATGAQLGELQRAQELARDERGTRAGDRGAGC